MNVNSDMKNGSECFCVRNVVCDYYLEPVNDFSALKYGRKRLKFGEAPPSVTVMRIFGITDTGTKCCVHVHGFLPYIIFRAKTRLTDALDAHFAAMVAEIVAQAPFARAIASATGAIFDVFDECAMSMYGYHESEEHFIRVVFYDPRIARLCTFAFQKECTRDTFSAFLQPFNAHIPVVLQFFVDFAISGMDLVRFSRRYLRAQQRPTPVQPEDCAERGLSKSPLRPMSNMALEFDVFTDDILNPFLATKSRCKLGGLEFLWEEERRRCELLGTSIDAATPGTVGVPEVWTQNEERLKAELSDALVTILRARNYVDPTQCLTQQQSSSSTIIHGSQPSLSQAVIDELRGVSDGNVAMGDGFLTTFSTSSVMNRPAADARRAADGGFAAVWEDDLVEDENLEDFANDDENFDDFLTV